mmetsp:Transcript_24790/g.49517  ORF Transcript_24790/g.49517 Transcript_24790/m.49517 type:complete len:114 (-) Transcript_24790:164-505(-)
MVKVHSQYAEKGFEILAFPCNQFGYQEPKTDAEIKKFAVEKYSAQFMLMSKIKVNGPQQHPVYTFLKAQPGCDGAIGWNFRTKFLVSKDGSTVKRFEKKTADLAAEIEKLVSV